MSRDAARGPVLAVCGLAFEATIAEGPDVRTLSRGGRSVALAEAIEREIDGGVVALISFGVAGALTSTLRPGALIVADGIVGPAGRFPTDPTWSTAICAVLPEVSRASIAGAERIVATPADKAALAAATGAALVDMESHIAARIAHDRGLPFVALRAVADPLRRSMPPAALTAMKEDGRVDIAAVVRSILGRPQQLPELLRIGLDTRRALDALRQGRLLLGSRLGYPDLDQLPVDVI